MKPWVLILSLFMAFLGGMAAYIVSVVRQAEPAQTELYTGVPVNGKLLELDKRALDESYHTHLIRLWGVWLADGGNDPSRITKGLQNARRAYHQASEQIAKREEELRK